MRVIVTIQLACLCFLFSVMVFETIECLLWSQYTLYQVVFAVSWPIPYKNPLRKLFFNIGFQFNYGEPFNLQAFYNATYWKNPFENRAADSAPSMQIGDDNENAETTTEFWSTTNEAETTTELFMGNDERQSRAAIGGQYDGGNTLVAKDLTAAQLYQSIERNILNVGYDQSCLMKSICELARHPLHHESDEEEHLLKDLVNFVLTPSKHQGFSEQESYERQKYETAQKIGEDGDDCNAIYPDCEQSLLDHVSFLEPSTIQ